MNNRGFTFVEVLLATTVGLALLFGVFLIPVEIAKMNIYTNENLQIDQDYNIVSLSLYEDVSKGVVSVTDDGVSCFDIENKVNSTLTYCFSELGITRTEDGYSRQLSKAIATYELNDRILNITLDYGPNSNNKDFYIFLEYPLMEIRGGLYD